jgi:predicted metal-binding protein
MRRFPPEAVGINLIKVMENPGLGLKFCKPVKNVCIGILLLE